MTTTRPTKEQLKQYLQDRRTQGGPPPTPAQIREQLGWALVQAEELQRKYR
jgi:hypothetical protein